MLPLQIGLGLAAGVGMIVSITLASAQLRPLSNELDTASANIVHVLEIPKDNTTSWQTFVEDWASGNGAEIITIAGHKAAVHGVELILRDGQLIPFRGELMMVDGKFEYEVYGFVPKSELIRAAEEAIHA